MGEAAHGVWANSRGVKHGVIPKGKGEMPKVTVKYPRWTGDWDNSLPQGSEIQLCWGRERDLVQLHVQYHGDRSGDVEPFDYYFDIDRSVINNMIRTLRRARDQAFGRDE